jgi:predicted TIM-barrel fold metal-dependent hydrolase
MPSIDADSHFMEPFDILQRYTEPAFRDRAMRIERDAGTGELAMVVDQRPLRFLDLEALLGAVVGYGQKEAGRDLSSFESYTQENPQWQDMERRVRFLDEEGFDKQVIYPSLGLIWEGGTRDPELVAALCRAYNTWAFELTSDYRDRLYPAAHISLRNVKLAVEEIRRVVKLGARTIFVAAMPVDGKSLGHPELDPVWAEAEANDMAVSLHLVGHSQYTGHQYYTDRDPGFMFITMNVIQDPRMALTTMVYDGVFDRFPRLRVGTIEAMAGWVGEWMERLSYRFGYMQKTSRMKRHPREYFDENIWICGDPEEKMFPLVVQFMGDEKFFFGSDYPHAEGFVHPVETMTKLLSELPQHSFERIMHVNAQNFFRF